MTRTSQDFAKFLESLKTKNEGPSVAHNPVFDWVDTASSLMIGQWLNQPFTVAEAYRVIERLNRRVVIAESNAKPETLVEDVKAYMRAAMDAEQKACEAEWRDIPDYTTVVEFRKLCEPGDK